MFPKPIKKEKVKRCIHCGGTNHLSFQCFTIRKKLNNFGKGSWTWDETKRLWFEANPPDEDGAWYCYIGGGKMDRRHTILDHIQPRGSSPSTRYSFNNLKPCCRKHNRLKGSQSLERFLGSNPDLTCSN